MMRAVTFFDGHRLLDGTLIGDAAGVRLIREAPPAGTARLGGVVTGLFTDHHVHVQLVDASGLATSRLGRVIDLGANVDFVRRYAMSAGVDVEYAGPFLTAVGGYPSDREWAPEGSVRPVQDAADVAVAIGALAAAGAGWIKVVGNSDAGPVLDDALLRATVDEAAAHGLPVIAHAEGAGQARRVARLGVARLAHSPFTERLSDDEILEQAASVSWVSTMAIHKGEAYTNVVANVRRFAASGGDLVYGSDMGNGDTPVDLRDSEVAALREAGVDGIDLLRALAPLDPLRAGAVLLLVPEGDPIGAHRITPADLEA